MDQAAALQQYTLQGVRETGVELGRGSYAAVYTVEYKGLTCAAKNFHQTLYQQEYSIRRFQEECAILSQLKHPNIVQFLGVYHQPGSMLPAIVMECLPMTLSQCLDQYGVLPNEIGYSILNDVALALSYLHQHDPPIIHRDLSANNILLTRGMIAKISDLGMAKMLDLSPTQMRTMTQTPGTQCYMPPEALEENAHYDCKVDAFSYGVLMVHLFSGQWPFPTKPVKVDSQDDSRVIPQTEADRRQEKLDTIGRDNPLMTLILRCLHNSPARRPEAVKILRVVSQVAAQFPPSSQNKVELLRQVTSLRADITSMTADAERLQQEHNTEITSLRESSSAELESTRQTLQAEIRSTQTQQKEAEKAAVESQRKLEDAERCHSVEMEQLNLRFADTRDTLSSKVGEAEAELSIAQQQISSKNSALSDRDNEVTKLTGQMAELRQEMVYQLTERKKAFDQCLLASHQRIVEKQKEFDQQLVEKQKSFDQQLLAKDQLLVEKQKEFDQQLVEKQKTFGQQLLAKDQLLVDKQKECDQQLLAKDQLLVEKQKEFDQQLIAKDQLLVEKQKAFDQLLVEKQKAFDQQLLERQKEFNQQLLDKEQLLAENSQRERELDQSLLARDQHLLEKDQLLLEKDQHLQKLREKEAEGNALFQSKEALLSSKESLVASKDSIIGGLQEQLDHLRKSHTAQVIERLTTQLEYLNTTYLAPNPFPNGAKLKWQKCKNMPKGKIYAQAVLIRGKVYIGGGDSDYDDDDYFIHEYSPTENRWATLPPAPVHMFGMGELNGQLVTVGGKTRRGAITRKVYMFYSSSQKWEESIPPMPTARHSLAVFSQQSCLTVVGGADQSNKPLSDVEIFIPQTSQWHKASPAPSPLSRMTTTVIHNKCYLAEYDSTELYQLCVSVDLATTNESSVTPHVNTEWKDFPSPPSPLLLFNYKHKCFALGSLNGSLLAVGGMVWFLPTNVVQSYSPITNTWTRVADGDLPASRHACSTVLLPTGELLVMGGWEEATFSYSRTTSTTVWRGAIRH